MRRKLIIGSYFTNYLKTITHQAEIFQGKLSTIIIFIPCKSVKICCLIGLTNIVQGLSIQQYNSITHILNLFLKALIHNSQTCCYSTNHVIWFAGFSIQDSTVTSTMRFMGYYMGLFSVLCVFRPQKRPHLWLHWDQGVQMVLTFWVKKTTGIWKRQWKTSGGLIYSHRMTCTCMSLHLQYMYMYILDSAIVHVSVSLHTVGKVSVNTSILDKNEEICNKTNLWKFQLISLFLLQENSKNIDCSTRNSLLTRCN